MITDTSWGCNLRQHFHFGKSPRADVVIEYITSPQKISYTCKSTFFFPGRSCICTRKVCQHPFPNKPLLAQTIYNDDFAVCSPYYTHLALVSSITSKTESQQHPILRARISTRVAILPFHTSNRSHC